ncbi:MAG TPA: hypothetical protein VFK14_14055 [Solirubrobacterales bacterium]|nr:hypothetical protein [Solirubrobacterales bacterium]
MSDAAAVADAATRAWDLAGGAQMLPTVARNWLEYGSDPGRSSGLEGLDTTDELRQRYGREKDRMDLFELRLERIGAAGIPQRLPGAYAQLEICAQSARRSWVHSQNLRGTLLTVLNSPQTSARLAEGRAAVAESVAENGPAIQACAETALIAGETARASVLPSHHEFLHLARLSYNSPLELILAINGAVAGTVAVLNQILDLRVKYKTRNENALAIRTKLEREIAEDASSRDACLEFKNSYPEYPRQFEITEVEAADDLGELRGEDDSSVPPDRE